MLAMIDLDNTLGDRATTVVRWAAEFCSRHSLPESFVDWFIQHDADGYSDRGGVFEALRREFGLDASADELIAEYRSRVVALTQPVPGAVELLRGLRAADFRLATVTNGASGQQHGKIVHLASARWSTRCWYPAISASPNPTR